MIILQKRLCVNKKQSPHTRKPERAAFFYPPPSDTHAGGRLSFGSTEFSRILEPVKAALAQHLVDGNRDGIRQIQTAEIRAHRQPYGGIEMSKNKILGQTARFASENKIRPARVLRLGIGARRFCREKIERIAAVLREKIVKTIVVGYVELIPIVEPRAPQLAVVYLKAERADEMQRSTGRRACAGDVAGVLRYLRLYKNNIMSDKIITPRKPL